MRFLTLIVLIGVAICTAQDVRINGSTFVDAPILQVTNTSAYPGDKPAVYGISKQLANYGVGVKGEGAWVGVYGIGNGPGGGVMHIGVVGMATGAGQNWGLYGQAPTQMNSYAGLFSGNVLVYGNITTMSDAKLKTNINEMGPALDKIMSLKPKTYKMLATVPGMADNSLPQTLQDGLIAQDVETVFPELVRDVTVSDPGAAGKKRAATNSATTYKGVNYMGLIPVLIKALQEQQDQITKLQKQVQKLKAAE